MSNTHLKKKNYHSVYQYSLFMCYYIQIYMYVIHWLCIEAPPWQEFGYIESLSPCSTPYIIYSVYFFLCKFLIQGFILIFFYLFILFVAHAMWHYSWLRVILYNYTFCHVNITYCGLALESKRITVNKVLNCI